MSFADSRGRYVGGICVQNGVYVVFRGWGNQPDDSWEYPCRFDAGTEEEFERAAVEMIDRLTRRTAWLLETTNDRS